MLCDKCGAENSGENKFCVECGSKLGGQEDQIRIESYIPLPPSKNTESSRDAPIDKKGAVTIFTVFIIAFALSAIFIEKDNKPTKKVETKVNPEYVSNDVQVTKAQADAIQSLIRAYGYTCSSFSSVTWLSYSSVYAVHCNNWRYSYELEDVGGNWVVTVD